MIIPDPLKKSVKIPVKIADGQIQYFYGGDLPKIANVSGDLVIPAFALLDPVQAQELSQQDRSEMLPAGSELLININVDTYAEGVLTLMRNPRVNLPTLAPKIGFVRARLEEPLYLWHRGTKTSQLSPSDCTLVDLNEEATSLNHAYTIASKKFETKRKSNTGNVFRHVYYKGKNGWERLEWLRERLDAKFEQRYVKVETVEQDPLEAGPTLFAEVDEYPAEEDLGIELESQTKTEPHINEHFPDSSTSKTFDEHMADGCYHYSQTFWRYNKRETLGTIPLRIRLKDFKFSKSQRRVLRINADLEIRTEPLTVIKDGEECKLFRRHKIRLGKYAPAEVKLPRGERNKKFCVFEDGRLIASSYLEMGAYTSYGYYAIFDPEIEWRSLGIFTMLKEIEYAKEQENEFYYLGYAYDRPTLYDYKKRFHGLQRYDWQTEQWKTFDRLV